MFDLKKLFINKLLFIIKIIIYIIKNYYFFYFIQRAPGGELQMILDRDEVPEERQVARLLKQILDGIAFLHSLNVAHLDIKVSPQTALVGRFARIFSRLVIGGTKNSGRVPTSSYQR